MQESWSTLRLHWGRNGIKFFSHQAQNIIAKGLEALFIAGFDVTLENVHNLLTESNDLEACLRKLDAVGSEASKSLATHFRGQFLQAPAEQLGGVIGTCANFFGKLQDC